MDSIDALHAVRRTVGRSDLTASVGRGPTGTDTALTPASAHVTRTRADACATLSRRTKLRLRREREGMTDVEKSVNIGNRRCTVPDWH